MKSQTRFFWENRWNLAHSESDNANTITTNTISSAFYYSLTNQLDLGVEARLTDTDDRIANNGNDELDKSINIGVKYRLK
jgi:predicted porin